MCVVARCVLMCGWCCYAVCENALFVMLCGDIAVLYSRKINVAGYCVVFHDMAVYQGFILICI